MVTMDAHWISVLIISFTLFFTVIYWFYILPLEKAKPISILTALLASILLTFVLFNGISKMGPFGGLLILSLWTIPSLLVWKYRSYFIQIDQRKLIGLQIFRLIGALFILEMTKGFIPASFALPAGLGDIIVGLTALAVFLFNQTPRWGVILVTILGLLDFASAFFFGFLSSEGPLQTFAIGQINQTNLFPTGMIPLFLVPYALVNHQISIINLKSS